MELKDSGYSPRVCKDRIEKTHFGDFSGDPVRLHLPMQGAGVGCILGQGQAINHMPLVGCGQKKKKNTRLSLRSTHRPRPRGDGVVPRQQSPGLQAGSE